MTDELGGRVVVLTRRREQGAGLRVALETRGAEVIDLPALEIAPPEDPGPLDAALRDLASFDWVAFASTNAVHAVAGRLSHLGLAASINARGPRLAAVGPATAAALREAFAGDEPALQPSPDSGGAALASAFVARGVSGARILLPVSSRGREELPQALLRAGARVERVVAYVTSVPSDLGSALARALRRPPDLFVFASPSAVEGVTGLLEPNARGLRAVVIGPTTEEAAHAAGFAVAGVAPGASEEGLLAAIVQALLPPPKS